MVVWIFAYDTCGTFTRAANRAPRSIDQGGLQKDLRRGRNEQPHSVSATLYQQNSYCIMTPNTFWVPLADLPVLMSSACEWPHSAFGRLISIHRAFDDHVSSAK